MTPPRSTSTPDTAILADAVYALADFRRRTGLGAWALRQARRNGLRVRKCGGRSFVIGADWLEYLRAQAPSQDGAAAKGEE